MILIEYHNNEQKGFDLDPKQEQAIKFLLLDMKPDRSYPVTPEQVEIIKSIWNFIHSDYVQSEFFYIFNDNFTQLKKVLYDNSN